MNGISISNFTVTLWQLSLPPPVWICSGILLLMLYTGKAPRPRSKGSWGSSPGFFDKHEQPVGYWSVCFLMFFVTMLVTAAANPWLATWLTRFMNFVARQTVNGS